MKYNSNCSYFSQSKIELKLVVYAEVLRTQVRNCMSHGYILAIGSPKNKYSNFLTPMFAIIRSTLIEYVTSESASIARGILQLTLTYHLVWDFLCRGRRRSGLRWSARAAGERSAWQRAASAFVRSASECRSSPPPQPRTSIAQPPPNTFTVPLSSSSMMLDIVIDFGSGTAALRRFYILSVLL